MLPLCIIRYKRRYREDAEIEGISTSKEALADILMCLQADDFCEIDPATGRLPCPTLCKHQCPKFTHEPKTPGEKAVRRCNCLPIAERLRLIEKTKNRLVDLEFGKSEEDAIVASEGA